MQKIILYDSCSRAYNYYKQQMADFEIEQVISNERDYAFISGDSLEILKKIPNETVNCVITSPPYWALREYDVAEDSNVIGNESDYRDYVKKLTSVFNETQRILTKEGSFSEIYSTDIEGINLMLGGTIVDSYPTEQEFILNIIRKGIQDGVLKKEDYLNFL